jgi:uncharacterized membrane protein
MFGHPLHPALVHFPIGLLLSSTLADIAWVTGLTGNVQVGAVMMAGGLAGGLLAMGAGMIDFSRLDARIVPHALRHMSAVGLAWLGYAIALYLRRDVFSGSVSVAMLSVWISLLSAGVLALGGWLGGRLVYTFGAGVLRDTPES